MGGDALRFWAYGEVTDPDDPSGGIVIATEEDILKSYYPYWFMQMKKKYPDWSLSPVSITSKEACIEDWVAVNWAWEIK